MRKRAYHKKSSRKNSSKKSSRGFFPWSIVILWGTFFCVTGYVIFYTPVLSVREITIQGTQRVDAGALRALVEEELSKKRFGYFASRHLFFVPKAHIAQKILTQFPRVATVSLTTVFPQSVSVNIHEHDVLIVYCQGDPARGHCVEIDTQNAHVTEEFVDLSTPRYEQNDLIIIVGSTDYHREQSVPFTPEIIAHLTTFSLEAPYYLATTIIGPYQEQTSQLKDVYVMTDDGWELRIDFTKDVLSALQRVQYALEHTDLGTARGKIDYIDARFDEKIYFQLKDDDVTETEVTKDQTTL